MTGLSFRVILVNNKKENYIICVITTGKKKKKIFGGVGYALLQYKKYHKYQKSTKNFNRSSRSEVFLGKGVPKIRIKVYRRTPMPRSDFCKVTKQLY